MRRWAYLCGPLAFLGVTGAAARAEAQGLTDIEGLLNETVVSAASKSAESASDAPAVISTITAEDMRKYGIRTIDEAINYLGLGLYAESFGSNDYGGIGGRGVLIASDYGNHVLLLLDGHAINEQSNGTAFFDVMAGIPLELIDRIELVLGPGSVLYGSNAMLGVVNVVTKRAKDFSGVHLIGELSYSPAQNQNGALDSASPSYAGKRYRVGAGFGYPFTVFGVSGEATGGIEIIDQQGPTYYFGPQTDAPAAPWGGGYAPFAYTIVPSLYSRVILGDFELKVRATSESHSYAGTSDTFDQKNSYERDRYAHLDLKYEKSLSERISISVRGYMDGYDTLEKDYYTSGYGCTLPGPFTGSACLFLDPGISRWAGGEVQGRYNALGDGRFTTLVGGEVRRRNVGEKEDQLSLPGLVNVLGSYANFNITDTVLSAYVQQIAQVVPWLRLNAGARADKYDEYHLEVSPRAVAILEPWTGGTLKFIWAQAFRAPSAYEQNYWSPGYQEVAPKLSPETVKSAEVSFDQRVGAQRFHVSVFDSWWRNMISTTYLANGEYQTQNLSSITNYGTTLSEDGTIGPIAFGVNGTIAWARREFPGQPACNPNEPANCLTPQASAANYGIGGVAFQEYGLKQPIDSSPSLVANARVAYALPEPYPTLGFAGWLVGPRYASGALSGAYDSLATLPKLPTSADFRVTLSGKFSFAPKLTYRLSADVATLVNTPGLTGTSGINAITNVAAYNPIPRLTTFVGLEYGF